MQLLPTCLAEIRGGSTEAVRAAELRQLQLTKPAGSMGALERLGSRLSGSQGTSPPRIPERPAIAVFAGDHGVHAQGVTPWPQEVTGQMVANIASGGAVVCALARQVGAELVVVDVGVAAPVDVLEPRVRFLDRNVARGTADLATGPALTREQAVAALEVGISVAHDLVDSGVDLLVTGEMGIANTTPAAALVAAFSGDDAERVTGRGTGVDDEILVRKMDVVRRAVERAASATDPVDVLAEVGGLEHAALAGLLLGGAQRRVPVVIDGVIAASAAITAAALAPDAVDHWVAGHLSAEPGARVALDHLGLEPLLDLGMRLGEGSGAALAVPLVQSAARLLNEVATFDSAGVTGKDAPA
jgi:nicotinate-nucleotide--dimethylbenzimidazole phosphoribosyltransferase